MKIEFVHRFVQRIINAKLSTVLILCLAVCILGTGCGQKNDNAENLNADNVLADDANKDSVNIGNDGVNAGIANDDDVAIVSQGKDVSDEMVSMSVENVGRADPFVPSAELVSDIGSGYEILPPPSAIVTDETATDVMTTKISGIMYDSISPSAILNIKDSDYLVRCGDIINGYKILYIAQNYVTVGYGQNIYKVGVGEAIIGDGKLNENTVSNLRTKFGGNKRR